jgi:N-acyl-D-amino-acid deacylase
MPEFDTIIRGGTIVDGTRMPRFRADIGIKSGRIARIGKLQAHQAARVIDASGAFVVPGFIDLHTHYDAPMFWDPYCTISSWHGVTSVVTGNCGFGFAPVHPEFRERAMLTMTRVEAIPYASMAAAMPWDWETYPQYLDSVDRRPKGINILPYVPLSPLITYVMGLEAAKSRRPTEKEMNEMCRLLDEAMEAGGCGFSAQRLHPEGGASDQRDFDGSPMVTDVMHHETALAFARVLAKRNEGFMQMTLATGDPEGDLRHLEALSEVSGRPLVWNGLRSNDMHPDQHHMVIKWLDSCRERGIRIYPQGVTTDAGFTFTLPEWNLFDECPAWLEATTGTLEDRIMKLSDPERRPALREAKPYMITKGIEHTILVQAFKPEYKPLEGMTAADIGAKLGKHPVDAILDIAIDDDLRTEFFCPAPNSRLDLQIEVAQYPYAIPGISDGGAHMKFLSGGIFTTEYLIKYVRDNRAMSVEEAHWKLSALPAYCAGFNDRGMLREGYAADIVIYDLDRLKILPQRIVFDMPAGEWRRVQDAEGYRNVLVNGEVEYIEGKPTGAFGGRLLRHGAVF